jgi:hypothetical protein
MILETVVIQRGRKFGDNVGGDFDDSLLPNFTYAHYLSGFRCSDVVNFNACQFIYSSSHHNQSQIESRVYGANGQRMNTTYKYHLDDDERIEKVQVKLLPERFKNAKTGPFTMKIIRGLKFITTKGRSFPPNINLTGNGLEVEYFPGYTLGYVTGKSVSTIHQLQFFWYRTEQQQQ